MENAQVLDLLQRLKVCLDRDSVDIARELVTLEINNLEGKTQKRCKNTKYYFYDWGCKYCTNVNCSSNKMVVNN